MRKGWEYKRWKEVLTIINGKNQSAVVDENGEYPIYGSGGIMGYANNWLCPGNCVIIGRKGNINKPIFVETKFWNVDTAFGLNANKEYLLPKFLYYFCLDYNFERHNKAVTIPSLTKADLLKIDIPLPPKSIQLAIVSELDKINELIRLKKEQLKDFDNLAQSLFYEMFGDPVENEKGWEVKKLGELLKVIGGYAFKSDKYKDEGIPILRIGNINSGFFRDTNLVFAESDEKLEKYKIFPGDIVISLTGTVGKSDYGNVCIMDDAYNFYYLNQRNAKLEIFGNLDKYYLSAILKNEDIKSRLTSISRGVRQANIANKDIENLQIPLPPLPLQQLFAHRIEQIEHQKAEVQKAITDLETLLASRMQYWFE